MLKLRHYLISVLVVAVVFFATFKTDSILHTSLTEGYRNARVMLGFKGPDLTEVSISTPYGTIQAHPVILELLETPAMKRIKEVRQYGVVHYLIPQRFEYTRFNHSVGVWALLKLKGAGLEEQIAGLLHDASHTVFSHVGDQLFKNNSDQSSYQDNIHEWFLRKMGVSEVLAKYGITLEQVLHKNGDHRALECDLPDVCADRLEYNLQGGLLTGMMTEDEVMELVRDAQFDGEKWYFTNSRLAAKLGEASLYNTKYVWGGVDTHIIDVWAAEALQRALDIKLLTLDDVHFSTDDVVWKKLHDSTDVEIAGIMQKLKEHKKRFKHVALADADYVLFIKCRGINPYIKLADGSFKRLDECEEQYKVSYDLMKNELKAGIGLAFADHADREHFRMIKNGRTT